MSNLLEVQNLSMHFPILGGLLKRPVGKVHAVNDVTFNVRRGETLGVVGESGCGKTTLGRTLVRLYEPTGGRILFKGKDLAHLQGPDLKTLRREVQMIFQDPYSSLNPRMTVRQTLEEPFQLHKIGDRKEREARIKNLVNLVGLRLEDLNKYPHEFSGGQRQRIGIARALTLDPSLVIADEPVSALDVSIQSQVLNLLVDLQTELGLTFIFISHDLNVVRYISDRIAVMYLGHVVELADARKVYSTPRHPYTQALLSAVPQPDPSRRLAGEPLKGEVPSPSRPPSGCTFHTRCPYATEKCKTDEPQLRGFLGDAEHTVACHYAEDIAKGTKAATALN